MNSLGNLGIRDVSHVTDCLGGLEVDHLTLVAQPAIQELHHGLPQRRIVFSQLCSQSYEQHECGGVLDSSSGTKLLYHLDQGHSIVRAHLIQQTDRVVLRHGRAVHGNLAARGREAKGESGARFLRRGSFLGLALPSANNILGNWQEVVR